MALSQAERAKAYRDRRNGVTDPEIVTQTVTKPKAVTNRDGWEWDEHHIYQKCPHGRRYCKACGTTVEPFVATPDQWSNAYRIMLASRERAKKSDVQSSPSA